MQFFVCSLLYFLGFIAFSIYVHFIELSDRLFTDIKTFIDPIESNYDYIIVGAGSAGSVVALRLAEDGANKVLVLEAGPNTGMFFDIPAIAPLLQLLPVDWKYKTEPQKHACKALNNNQSFWPMGRIVGGTSQLNNLIYTRGHIEDFKEWYQDFPIKDFDYNKDILPHFKSNQDYKGAFTFNEKCHSRGGLLETVPLNFFSNLQQLILNAFQSLGFNKCDVNCDMKYNEEEEEKGCVTPIELSSLKNGKRYTAGNLLTNARNLRLLTNAQVDKILFKSNYEAYAVKYTIGWKKQGIVKAKKGIILSAGVIGTPKLLMLSGIGPKNHLNSIGIKTRINLPVGENLQDHITTGFDLIILDKPLNFPFTKMCEICTIFDYLFKGKGAWTTIGAEALAFAKINDSKRADIEFMALPMGVPFEGGKRVVKITNIKEEVFEKYFKKLIGKTTISLIPVLLHPKSKGYIKLQDSNPNSHPIINPNYLNDPSDVVVLKHGINIIKELLKSEIMIKMGARIYNESLPGCEHLTFDSENYWECYIRHLTFTSYHPVGTCKLGNRNNGGVINWDFQVHETNKLFVVDGSILPTPPSGNPNAVITMFAEKASKTIKKIENLNTATCNIARKELFLI